MVQLRKHRLDLGEVLHRVFDITAVGTSSHTQQKADDIDGDIHTEQDACRLSPVTFCPGIRLGDLFANAILLTQLITPYLGASQTITLLFLVFIRLSVLEYIHGT